MKALFSRQIIIAVTAFSSGVELIVIIHKDTKYNILAISTILLFR